MTATAQGGALEVATSYLERHDPRYLAENVTLDVVPDNRVRVGRGAVAAAVHDLTHGRFHDVDDAVTAVHALGDEVLVEVAFAGRPVPGRWSGPVTGRRVTVRAAIVCRIVAGEIAVVRLYYDAASLYRDLYGDRTSPSLTA
jgi:ketosteroid isomerase-like protein